MRHHPHMTAFLATETPILGGWSTRTRPRGNDHDPGRWYGILGDGHHFFLFLAAGLTKETIKRHKQRKETENGTVMMAEWHRKCHSPHHLTATDPWMIINLWFW